MLLGFFVLHLIRVKCKTNRATLVICCIWRLAGITCDVIFNSIAQEKHRLQVTRSKYDLRQKLQLDIFSCVL